ncbi:hypothetical protein K474DRAFT_1712564 [Panus rudis PR-1116 ss-1]|nr:hypothetical protein K474DRAFT_1712564 [Panus rudis PR-1116 ss-1]
MAATSRAIRASLLPPLFHTVSLIGPPLMSIVAGKQAIQDFIHALQNGLLCISITTLKLLHICTDTADLVNLFNKRQLRDLKHLLLDNIVLANHVWPTTVNRRQLITVTLIAVKGSVGDLLQTFTQVEHLIWDYHNPDYSRPLPSLFIPSQQLKLVLKTLTLWLGPNPQDDISTFLIYVNLTSITSVIIQEIHTASLDNNPLAPYGAIIKECVNLEKLEMSISSTHTNTVVLHIYLISPPSSSIPLLWKAMKMF